MIRCAGFTNRKPTCESSVSREIKTAPEVPLRRAFGEMADALLLASTRVVPARLQGSGFVFEDSELRQTLKRIVNSRV
jgi:NAD dependent epimerase/dehydratase family enzyme